MENFNHLKIVSADYRIGDTGFAMNMGIGLVVGEVQLQDAEGNTFFYTNDEYDSRPTFIKTKESVLEMLALENECDKDKIQELLEHPLIDKYEYSEVLEDKDNPLYFIFCYLTYLVQADEESTKTFIQNTVGKYLDEIEIPMDEIIDDIVF